jgi:L-asparaginase
MTSTKVVILGTGGTIAGTAARPDDAVGYSAAQLGIAHLMAAVPVLRTSDFECEQVAQLDSKDMDFATWQRLAARAAHHLARGDVAGVVVTHGTDTLEETAYLLHRVLAGDKPLVLTAAMRPATSIAADGPANLLDAVTTARDARARGVLMVMAGRVWAGAEVRKVHSYRVDAFAAGDAGPLALVEEGALHWLREVPRHEVVGLARIARDAAQWPRVEIVTSHAGAGTLHRDLEAALLRAQAAGVQVLRCTRCAAGPVIGQTRLRSAGTLSAPQARVELLLQLLA